jgi:hypothetical protein
MNRATLHSERRTARFRPRPSARTRGRIEDPADLEPQTSHLKPASYSYLEPQGEGILFAAFCLISSLIIYCGVLLIRFLA